MWLQKFKIALVENDSTAIAALIDTMPRFETLDEMREAAALCEAARDFLQTAQADTLKAKQQLRKNIDFLRSAHADAPASGLDITS